MELDASLLNTQHYKVRVKWSNPGKEVAPSPTPLYSSYWKGSLRVTLDYGRQLYFYFYGTNSTLVIPLNTQQSSSYQILVIAGATVSSLKLEPESLKYGNCYRGSNSQLIYQSTLVCKALHDNEMSFKNMDSFWRKYEASNED